MTSYSHLLGSSTKIPMLISEYYDQRADRIEDYLNGIDEELWKYVTNDFHPLPSVQGVGTSTTKPSVTEQTARLLKNEKRFTRELRRALPPVVYNYILSCKTSKEIWNTLKEKHQGSEKTKIISVKQCMLELREFKQKGESIELFYDRMNELIYK